MRLGAGRSAAKSDSKRRQELTDAARDAIPGSLRKYDVAVVGGGPAGLTAATYLARFRRSVVVLDAGDPRAALIPLSRNCPGFPEGVGGSELLCRLRKQACAYGAEIVEAPVLSINGQQDAFTLSTHSGNIKAARVVLATGLVDKAPAIAGLQEAIAAGWVGLCPVCDGYEASAKRVGVVGQAEDALKEALSLLTYSKDVIVLANDPEDVGEAVRKRAAISGIEIWDTIADVTIGADGLAVAMADGSSRQLDMLYSAMGCDVRSELAMRIGADCDDKGFILVGPHLETSVAGVYAIGDVAQALNQIAVGFGHAALAATHIHNALRDRDPRTNRSVQA